jgi:ferredoxin
MKLLKPSTRAFLAEARRTPNYSWLDWLHGYVYARWPYLYISLGTGEHRLARWLTPLGNAILKLSHRKPAASAAAVSFADTYHGKVVLLESAKQLVTVNQAINLTNLEHVIPYARARDLILQANDTIVALECPCRAARPNPCSPLDVCLIIGDPLARFVAEHHPTRSRRLTQAQAVEILEAEHNRGHVHHAFFKDAMLGRFYAICNCCACCCGAMQGHRNGVPMLASSGYVSQVNPAACTGCGACVRACQFKALAVENGTAVVNAGQCMGCGVCVSKCKQEAIAIRRDPTRGQPLELPALMQELLHH